METNGARDRDQPGVPRARASWGPGPGQERAVGGLLLPSWQYWLWCHDELTESHLSPSLHTPANAPREATATLLSCVRKLRLPAC